MTFVDTPAILGQTTLPADQGSYAAAWDSMRTHCNGLIGEDACDKLLGYKPFVCPVDQFQPRQGGLRSLIVPFLVGLVVGKIIL